MLRIYHKLEERVIYPVTTDRHPVIYWATNHLYMEARLYFDSYTQETTERQVYPSDFFQISAVHEKKSRQELYL